MTIKIEANPHCGIKVDASIIAEPFRNEIRQRVQSLNDNRIGTFIYFVIYIIEAFEIRIIQRTAESFLRH
jgi:hypothetical protein